MTGTRRALRSAVMGVCILIVVVLALGADTQRVYAQTEQPDTATPPSAPLASATATPAPTRATRTLTAEATASPDATEVVCPDTLPTRLVIGERGRVAIDDPRPLNIRAGAGTSNEIIGQIPARGIFVVLDGPRCSQRYSWYEISYRDADTVITGWIAEGDENVYFVEVYPPGW